MKNIVCLFSLFAVLLVFTGAEKLQKNYPELIKGIWHHSIERVDTEGRKVVSKKQVTFHPDGTFETSGHIQAPGREVKVRYAGTYKIDGNQLEEKITRSIESDPPGLISGGEITVDRINSIDAREFRYTTAHGEKMVMTRAEEQPVSKKKIPAKKTAPKKRVSGAISQS